jgi:hypothetical protein
VASFSGVEPMELVPAIQQAMGIVETTSELWFNW